MPENKYKKGENKDEIIKQAQAFSDSMSFPAVFPAFNIAHTTAYFTYPIPVSYMVIIVFTFKLIVIREGIIIPIGIGVRPVFFEYAVQLFFYRYPIRR